MFNIFGKIERKFSDKSIYLSFPLGITAAVFLNQFISLLRLKEIFKSYSENVQSQMFLYPLFTGIVIYGIITPLLEEAVFRWILFGRLKFYMTTAAAAIFSSIIFGVYHGNFVQFIYATLFGLILCFVCWRYDTALASVMTHAAANVTVYTTASVGGLDFLSTREGEVISIMISGFISYFIIRFIYENRPKNRHEIKKLPIFPRKWDMHS